MFKIGCKVLMFNAIALILIGIYAIFLNTTPLFYIINWIMDPNFWTNEVLSEGTKKFKVFTWDYLGMFHVIWGVNMFYVIKYGLQKNREAWAWKSLAISVAVWMFVDIIFTYTIKSNTFLFGSIVSCSILFILPLYMTKEVLKIKKA
jgi:hypothetical protein